MPITPFLDGAFDPEATRNMGIAFEMARTALRLAHRDDSVNAIVAKKIIELAKEGERDPQRLCEAALRHLREPPRV
jgi:hypothetical protein